MDAYSPVRGKCQYWREAANEEDRWDLRLKDEQRHVECTCFVEGDRWVFLRPEVPEDCPMKRSCRYYIKFE